MTIRIKQPHNRACRSHDLSITWILERGNSGRRSQGRVGTLQGA